MQVKWRGGNAIWVPLNTLKESNPVDLRSTPLPTRLRKNLHVLGGYKTSSTRETGL